MSNLFHKQNPLGMRPIELLPLPFPSEYDPGPEYFYNNFVKPMITDTIQMMCVGIHIDKKAVHSLRLTIDNVLSNVDALLLRNDIIKKYQKERHVKVQKTHFAKSTQAVKTAESFYRDYENNVQHRTWIVNTYLKSTDCSKDVRTDWTVKDLKSFNSYKADKILKSIIDKSIGVNSETAINGMKALSEYKAELWNRPRYDKANSTAPLEAFNPGSAKQLQELFLMLGIPAMAFSAKTGDGSWGREYIEILYKQSDGTNKELDEILECIIDHSFGGIIRSTFLKAFDRFTINGVLHGNIKLFGAKSFRNTSNSPNLLNMPSTKSIYAKPLKKCFVAPEGMLIYAIDLSALEDRVIANLSGDVNKSNIFLEGLDGHSLNACGYFPEEISEFLGKNIDNVKYVKEFHARVQAGDKLLDAIRFRSKAPTFKLALTG
jgi:DNA polymerase I-like protein with 3'-5' exonuclease and polymerase domains